jgi:DNA-directed RNA polymerase subunit RPC12/RpoP
MKFVRYDLTVGGAGVFNYNGTLSYVEWFFTRCWQCGEKMALHEIIKGEHGLRYDRMQCSHCGFSEWVVRG